MASSLDTGRSTIGRVVGTAVALDANAARRRAAPDRALPDLAVEVGAGEFLAGEAGAAQDGQPPGHLADNADRQARTWEGLAAQRFPGRPSSRPFAHRPEQQTQRPTRLNRRSAEKYPRRVAFDGWRSRCRRRTRRRRGVERALHQEFDLIPHRARVAEHLGDRTFEGTDERAR